MLPTGWQAFWRWIVALQIIVGVAGFVIGFAFGGQIETGAPLAHADAITKGSAAGLALFFSVPAIVALILLGFTVPILLFVELHAWWQRRAERKEWLLVSRSESYRRR